MVLPLLALAGPLAASMAGGVGAGAAAGAGAGAAGLGAAGAAGLGASFLGGLGGSGGIVGGATTGLTGGGFGGLGSTLGGVVGTGLNSAISGALFGGPTGEVDLKGVSGVWTDKAGKNLYNSLLPSIEQYISTIGDPYGGDFVAPIAPLEQQGLDSLSAYMNQQALGQDPLSLAGRTELQNTFNGTYDPISGPYYQALRAQALVNQGDAQSALAARTSASDSLFGGGRIKGEADIATNTANTLNLSLGQLFENERARRLGAVPLAQKFAQTEQADPLNRAIAGLQYGGLSRQLDQAQLTALYKDFLRQRGEQQGALTAGQKTLSLFPPTFIAQEGQDEGLLGGLFG